MDQVHDGPVTWVTAAAGARMLGDDVTPDMIRDWRRRGLVTGVRSLGRWWYALAALQQAEAHTFGRGRPRGRSGDQALQ